MAKTIQIEVKKIHLDPNQPREVYDGIDDLAESMRNKGFIEEQAITVRPHPEIEGEYMVVMGHRRTLAAQKAELATIHAFIRENLTEAELIELQLVENANRKDLPPMNQIRAYKKALDAGLSHGRIARIYGISEKTLMDDLELLGLEISLHPIVDSGKLSKAAAKILVKEVPDMDKQKWLYNNKLKALKSVETISAAITAYLEKDKQLDLFKIAAQSVGDSGMKPAKKAFQGLKSVALRFEREHLGDKNIINAHKNNIGEVTELAKTLKKISDAILADVVAFNAKTALNKAVNE